jgi:hypothetical protein
MHIQLAGIRRFWGLMVLALFAARPPPWITALSREKGIDLKQGEARRQARRLTG